MSSTINTATQSGTLFNIPIKQQNNTRTINIASLLMLVISLGAFLFNAIVQRQVPAIVCFTILLLLTIYGLYNVFNRKPAFAYLNIILLLVAVFWFVQGGITGILMGIVLIVAALFERRFKNQHTIIITQAGVTLQTDFKTNLPWQQLSNVIIRDGLITIDAKNNKIWQKEVKKDLTATEEVEINAFCRLQLSPKSARQ